MRVYFASDHAGFELKKLLMAHAARRGHEAVDRGPRDYAAGDDYPDYVIPAAEAVVADDGSLGVVLGGSGNGEQIAANKVPGIRAALAWNEETARLAREHNNANVIAIGQRTTGPDIALKCLDAFLDARFSGEERHVRRIRLITAYEARGLQTAATATTKGRRWHVRASSAVRNALSREAVDLSGGDLREPRSVPGGSRARRSPPRRGYHR